MVFSITRIAAVMYEETIEYDNVRKISIIDTGIEKRKKNEILNVAT